MVWIKQDKSAITEEKIRQLISSTVKKEVSAVERSREGLINDVFFVRAGTNELVLRVSPGEGAGHPGFEGERWALGECAKAGVPVPKVVSFGKVKTSLPKPCP